MKYRILLLFVALSVGIATLYGQIQTPKEFLPQTYGKAFTPHHKLVEYFKHVAAESDKVILQEIGETNEHRPMFLAIVSTPENIDRIEDIRVNNLRLAGLEAGDGDLNNAKAIVWLGYSVHGNEAGGSEASLQVIYDLATGANGSAAWLENAIVILEPSVNPDGYNRYSNWNNQVSNISFDASTDAREHHEPWPGGRVNHYLFDLNRDWAWLTQIESKNRIAAYRKWMPHVVADLHEMGYTNPYYFAPAAQPYHEFISDWQRDFQVEIGRNHARHFDREGWTYFTKEVFDLFYPSYGDTYPVFNGAIGMTYEQGGHGFAGRGILLPNGDTLFLADRIEHHRATSLSTIEVTSNHSSDVVREFRDYFKRSASNPPGQYMTYVIKGTNPEGKLRDLCEFLDAQGIEYGSVSGSTKIVGAFAYRSGEDESFTLNDSDLVISAFQPRSVLTQVLFDPESKLVDTLTYDITCWSLPFAYGLDAYALKVKVNVTSEFNSSQGRTRPAGDAYAYALRWESVTSAQFLGAASQVGFRARFAEAGFEIGNNTYPSGTVLFLKNDNRHAKGFPGALISLAMKKHVQLEGLSTGFVDAGKDFGSSSYSLIDPPAVLTISGDGVSANSFGQIWYLFEQVLHYPLTVVDVDNLGSIEWSSYNTIVLPEGYYSISESTRKKLDSWIEDGGKVIAIGSALSQFRDKDGYALKQFADSSKADEIKKAEEKDRLELRLESYGGEERRDISSQMPGAVFRCKVDSTHPLGQGFNGVYYTLKTSTTSYEHLVDADNVIYLDDNPGYYGFAGYKAVEKQKDSVIAAMESKGSGALIYFVDNPLFRSFWKNGEFLFCNALFLAGN